MRYIVIQYNTNDPGNPHVRTFASHAKADAYDKASENQCEVYAVGESLIPQPAEPYRTLEQMRNTTA